MKFELGFLTINATNPPRAVDAPAIKDKKSTFFELNAINKELRAAMFLIGVDSVPRMIDVGVDIWI